MTYGITQLRRSGARRNPASLYYLFVLDDCVDLKECEYETSLHDDLSIIDMLTWTADANP